jgi:N-acetyl-gamma-glutamyl-phosphate reductase
MGYSPNIIVALLLTVAGSSSAFSFMAATFRQSTVLDMATKKVFIDGEAGTTGLQVRDRLSKREDIEIISPPSNLRKDEETRKKFINEADAVILCLPDAASIEAASWVEPDNDRTVLIDASTAFRVDDNWTYGFPGEFHFCTCMYIHIHV